MVNEKVQGHLFGSGIPGSEYLSYFSFTPTTFKMIAYCQFSG